MKTICILLTIVGWTTVFGVNGQSKSTPSLSDLDGRWLLDKKASTFEIWQGHVDERYKYGDDYEDYELNISQKNDLVQIIQKFRFKGIDKAYNETISTNAAGETNAGPHFVNLSKSVSSVEMALLNVEVKSKSLWKNGRLRRHGTYAFTVTGWDTEYSCILDQVFELSKDGKDLYLTSSVQILYSPTYIDEHKSRLVFHKA